MSGGGAGRRRWRLVRARTDAVPASLRRLMNRRWRRLSGGRGRRVPWGLVAVGVVLAVLAGWALTSTSLLGVHQVRVAGADLVAAAEVREAAGVREGTPLLRVDRAAVAQRVGQLPAVASVTVHRAWPRTLEVRVSERVPVAAVPDEDGYRLVARDGVVFHQLPELPPGLPTLALADPGPDDPATRAAVAVLASLTSRLRDDLRALVVAGPARIELELRSGYTVIWGDETDSAEKARVATALLEGDAVADAAGEDGVIDVSSPEVVVVR